MKGANMGANDRGVSLGDILGVIHGVTGNPSCGAVADWTPAIAQAINELINGKADIKEARVIKPNETRTPTH
jgi:hypothetical protein